MIAGQSRLGSKERRRQYQPERLHRRQAHQKDFTSKSEEEAIYIQGVRFDSKSSRGEQEEKKRACIQFQANQEKDNEEADDMDDKEVTGLIVWRTKRWSCARSLSADKSSSRG
ncbi:hypothetical protein CVT26_004617 [Gymnopilus dilepis]|uniref:Uncharacterized protein n=1 Tax=Gymnopilus dilepis TaxID=231916 RepID=A0A409YJD2_9AGAR|nr:hypothetical protein CVT26_004617 [Gymnopilus dilepis]